MPIKECFNFYNRLFLLLQFFFLRSIILFHMSHVYWNTKEFVKFLNKHSCSSILISVARSSVTESGTKRQKRWDIVPSKSGHKNLVNPVVKEPVYNGIVFLKIKVSLSLKYHTITPA